MSEALKVSSAFFKHGATQNKVRVLRIHPAQQPVFQYRHFKRLQALTPLHARAGAAGWIHACKGGFS